MSYKLAGLWGPEPFLSSVTGRPLASTPFTVYKRDGVTVASLYTSRTKAVAASNPTQTDTRGNASFYADPGDYIISCGGATLNVQVQPDQSEFYLDTRRGHDTGLASPVLAETMLRADCVSDLAALTTQIVTLVGIELPPRTTVTYLSFISGATAANTPTNWWFVLCDKNRAVLTATPDQTTTAWAANTLKTLAVSPNYTTPDYPDFYYVGVMMKATTVVSLRGSNLGHSIISSAFSPTLCGASSTGQTTPPAAATVLTSITAGSVMPYCAVT